MKYGAHHQELGVIFHNKPVKYSYIQFFREFFLKVRKIYSIDFRNPATEKKASEV